MACHLIKGGKISFHRSIMSYQSTRPKGLYNFSREFDPLIIYKIIALSTLYVYYCKLQVDAPAECLGYCGTMVSTSHGDYFGIFAYIRTLYAG